MGDITLVEGLNELNVALVPESVVLEGRVDSWDYSTTCSYPTVHRETGDWPDHALDFDYDLYPSTWFIDLKAYNDSIVGVSAEIVIVASNANIVHYPSPRFGDPNIAAGSSKWFSFCMTLPRVPGEYYFDIALKFGGIVVLEERWTINYT